MRMNTNCPLRQSREDTQLIMALGYKYGASSSEWSPRLNGLVLFPYLTGAVRIMGYVDWFADLDRYARMWNKWEN